jgi:hypothetical protein
MLSDAGLREISRAFIRPSHRHDALFFAQTSAVCAVRSPHMRDARTPPSAPIQVTSVDQAVTRETRAQRPTVGRALALCAASFGVMAPWPLLAILATQSLFESWNEAALLFGGLTGIPLLIFALVGISESVFVSLILIVWFAALLVPHFWFARRVPSRNAVGVLLGLQTGFSFAQAALGALMVVGKSV